MAMQNGGQQPGLRRCGARVETQAGKAIADRPPGTGDHRPTIGRSADISVIFHVSYIGRLKRPLLHCWADAERNFGYQRPATETSASAAPYHL